MQRSLVLTLLGPDRPGLVERLSQLVVEQGGNWVESRMARLGGQFAGILRVDLPSATIDAFRVAAASLADAGLQLVIAEPDADLAAPELRPLRLSLLGHDRPGIVREIAQVLASRNVNVEELETGLESAPMSGEQLFFARARLGIPSGVAEGELRRALEQLAGDLMVDIHLGDAQ